MSYHEIPMSTQEKYNKIILLLVSVFMILIFFISIPHMTLFWIVANSILIIILLYITIPSIMVHYSIIISEKHIKIYQLNIIHQFVSIPFKNILFVAFVQGRYSPLLQTLKKREKSDVLIFFIVYERKKRTKRVRTTINLKDFEFLKKFLDEKGVKILPEKIFIKCFYNYKKCLSAKIEDDGDYYERN